MRSARWILSLLVLSTAGCANSCDDGTPRQKAVGFRADLPAGSRELITAADTLELIALSSEPVARADGATADDPSLFHGLRVLGRAEASADERAELARLLLEDIDQHKSTMVACNEPHHGFRFTRGGETVDLVMSFGCLHGTLYAPKGRTTVLTRSQNKPAINKAFVRHQLPTGS